MSTRRTMTVLLLRTDGSREELVVPAVKDEGDAFACPDFEALRKHVRYEWFELVRCPGRGMLLIDEEGRLKDNAQLNAAASALAWQPIIGDAFAWIREED